MDKPEATLEDFTLMLSKPVAIGEASYDRLLLREPLAGQWERWYGIKGVAGEIRAISVVSGLPEIAVGKIGAKNIVLASKFLGQFLNEKIELPEADEFTLDLRRPVSFAGKTYSTLYLHEPTGHEWVQWDDVEGVEADIKAIAIVSNIPADAIRQIGVRDLRIAARFISRFLD